MTDAQQLAANINFDAGRPGRNLLRQALAAAARQRRFGDLTPAEQAAAATAAASEFQSELDQTAAGIGQAMEQADPIPAAVLEELEELEEAEAIAVTDADLADASLRLAEDTLREAQEAADTLRDRHTAAVADLDRARDRTVAARKAAGVVRTADGYRRAAR